jgi:hypothetical protein
MAPAPANGWANSRLVKRVGIAFVIFTTTVIFITILTKIFPGANSQLPDMRKVMSLPGDFISGGTTRIQPSCASDLNEVNPLTALDAKYAHLADDKFTYVC